MMETFNSVTGVAAAMMQINIDTDQMIPARYLGGTDAKGYGAHLFANERFTKAGEANPEFILNQAPFDRAVILLAGRNFGCGSSRERAPKALREFGFRCVIAPSFGGIFFNNCFRNGLLPVTLPIEALEQLVHGVEASRGAEPIAVDLQTQTIQMPSRQLHFEFQCPESFRQMLLLGLDEIDQTLALKDTIESWRRQDRLKRPWAYTEVAQSSQVPFK